MSKDKEPTFSNWREAWNYYATQSETDYSQLTETELLEIIKDERWDMFYSNWEVIGKKGTMKNSALVLYEVLVNEDDDASDLVRYHCAGALFKILGIEEQEELREHCQWKLGDRKESLEELLKIIKNKLNQTKLNKVT